MTCYCCTDALLALLINYYDSNLLLSHGRRTVGSATAVQADLLLVLLFINTYVHGLGHPAMEELPGRKWSSGQYKSDAQFGTL